MNVLQLIMQARANKGITVSYNGVGYTAHSFSHGFMVSAPEGIENLPSAALIPAVIEAFVDANPLGMEVGFLGLWQDDNGNWSVDVSFLVETLAAATETAHGWNQRAIWDNANQRPIVL